MQLSNYWLPKRELQMTIAIYYLLLHIADGYVLDGRMVVQRSEVSWFDTLQVTGWSVLEVDTEPSVAANAVPSVNVCEGMNAKPVV